MILIYILVAIIVALIGSSLLLKQAASISNTAAVDLICLFGGVVGIIATVVTSIAYAFTVYAWLASEAKASILNREYGTNYTAEEVFYASDVIDTIRQLDRKRIEVNGDLFREEADPR